jgi:uncharacterized lipoprotein YmbA
MKSFTRTLKLAAVLGVGAALAGCASRPVEHFYTVSGQRLTSISTETPQIAVTSIAIPPLIDRPQIVVRTSGHELSVLEDHRWAEPLSVDLTRALIGALRQVPGNVQVAERDSARAAPLVLQVTISELLAGPGSSVSLQASWELRDRKRTCVMTGRFATEIPRQAGYEAIPAAYALAMSRLAETIGASIGQSGTCKPETRVASGAV